MPRPQIKPTHFLVIFTLGLMGATAALILTTFAPGLSSAQLPTWPWPDQWRYADSQIPMLFASDGYLWLHLTQQALDQGLTSQTPFLPFLAYLVTAVGWGPPEALAFYLPIVFSMALGILAAAWGRIFNVPPAISLLMAFLVNLVPAWVGRSGPGFFDTDPAINLFWQGLILALTLTVFRKKFSRKSSQKFSQKTLIRPLALAGALASTALLVWAWKFGALLALGTWVAWALLVIPRHRWWGLKIRLILALLLGLWGIAVLWLPPHLAPVPTAWAVLFKSHFDLAFATNDLFYTSIKELQTATFVQWLGKIGGTYGGGLIALGAGGLLFLAHPAARLPLLLALGCAAAGIRADCFIYLAALTIALSVAMLPYTLPPFMARLSLPQPFKPFHLKVMTTIMILGFGSSCLYSAIYRDYLPHWTRGDDRLALALAQTAAPGARLWNWWDDGYFLLARTGLKPLFDGGSQTSTMAFIAARPLLYTNRALSARWMRFFAWRGKDGLAPLTKIYGEKEAWIQLEKRLVNTSTKDNNELKLPPDWLDPQGEVYLFLPLRFMRLSSWWVTMGITREPSPKLVKPHLEAVPRAEFNYFPQTNTLGLDQKLIDRGYTKFSKVYATQTTPVAPPWPARDGLFFVFSEKNDFYGYITDLWGLKSLPLTLLAPGGTETPNFHPVLVDPAAGGVWRVE